MSTDLLLCLAPMVAALPSRVPPVFISLAFWVPGGVQLIYPASKMRGRIIANVSASAKSIGLPESVGERNIDHSVFVFRDVEMSCNNLVASLVFATATSSTEASTSMFKSYGITKWKQD
ncbi:hypothetical protein HN011_004419 [Eciton burchellii]|nr:hypothetical protein HN011_004419 [Eciton burchellii]